MKKLFVLSLFIICMSISVQAVEYYDDGQEHDISTPINDGISIWNGEHHLPETFTTVNLQSGSHVWGAEIHDQSILNVYAGGGLGGVDIYDQSIFNVFAGSETGMVRSHLESNFEIFDGIVHDIELYDFSYGTISGGTVSEINVWDQSHISVSGGEVLGSPVGSGYYTPGLRIYEHGAAEISGGFLNQVVSLGNSTIEMSDGIVQEMNLNESSTANITGGRIDQLSLHENSQLVMINVFGDPMAPGGVTAYDSSHVSMTGGRGFISARGNSIVEVSNAIDVGLDIQDNAQVTVTDSEINYFPELGMNGSLNLINTTVYQPQFIMTSGTSHLTASTGTLLNSVDISAYSTFTLSGGFVNGVWSMEAGAVEIEEGDVYELHAIDDTRIEVSGGHVGYLDAQGMSQVEITGGAIETLVAGWQSQVDILGGNFSWISAQDLSTIVINGFDFNYGYGYITDTSGFLTGTLLSGDIISVNFERLGDAQILIVPEPATLSLLALGALALFRRRK